ncbi:hypothetical protein KY285_030568 [Solanum tuberosum]|nr:hypothetical protein KY285_030568 [Solanum tuberosum]
MAATDWQIVSFSKRGQPPKFKKDQSVKGEHTEQHQSLDNPGINVKIFSAASDSSKNSNLPKQSNGVQFQETMNRRIVLTRKRNNVLNTCKPSINTSNNFASLPIDADDCSSSDPSNFQEKTAH